MKYVNCECQIIQNLVNKLRKVVEVERQSRIFTHVETSEKF